MKQKNKNIKGFTLIEMMVVVLIIGILAAIALPQYQRTKIKAEFAEVFPKLKTAAQIEEMCRLQYGVEVCDTRNVPRTAFDAAWKELDTEVNNCYENDIGNCWPFMKFNYMLSGGMSSDSKTLASALYLKEDVCICITDKYQFVMTQNDGGCYGTVEATRNYSEILDIPDVTSQNTCEEDGYCCFCC